MASGHHHHHHQERFCPACENGAHGGYSPRDYSRNTVRAIATEKKRVDRRHKLVLALRQKIDELDRDQLELYHTILQNERLAALDTLRQYAQEANADIQTAKDKLADVETTNRNKGYFGVAKLKEAVEDANRAVYRLREELTAASAELLEVIAIEDNEPVPEPEQTSPVKQLRISNQGDIDITFDQSQQSDYHSVNRTPSRFAKSSPRFASSLYPMTSPRRSSTLRITNQPTPPPVYHPYNRSSFNRTPATDRFMQQSPGLRKLLPPHRQRRSPYISQSVGYNVHEANNPLQPKGYTIPLATESPGQSPMLRNPGADRTYRPEPYESSYEQSVMGSAPVRSPVRNLHISKQGDIDISVGPSIRHAVWHSGGGSRVGAPASSFRSSVRTPARRHASPAVHTQSTNDQLRSTPGPISQSIFYDAPIERTSPVGAETFNRRYHDSLRATGV